MPYHSELNPQQASRDLAIVREAMVHSARTRTGDGLYFFIWGWATGIILLLQRFFPGDLTTALCLALYAATIVASGMVGSIQSKRGESDSRDFIYWLVIIGESFLFSVLFIVLNGRGFNPDYLDVINMMLFSLGMITIGSFSNLRVTMVGFAEIIIAVILPALLPLADDRIIAVAIINTLCYTLAGWFINQTAKDATCEGTMILDEQTNT